MHFNANWVIFGFSYNPSVISSFCFTMLNFFFSVLVYSLKSSLIFLITKLPTWRILTTKPMYEKDLYRYKPLNDYKPNRPLRLENSEKIVIHALL